MRVNNATQLQGLRNMATLRPDITLDSLRERQRGCLPDLLGVEVVSLESGTLTGKLTIPPNCSRRTASCMQRR
jgi:hypothetical protein